MIPVAFDYLRPSTVEDAIVALAEAGDEAKILAGGQSLLPVLRLRLAAPSLLVDLGALPQLRGVRLDEDDLVIGALTRHASVASAPLVLQHAPLVAMAAAKVGDRQVRRLGTIGGSLAHADPGADLPAVMVALGAKLVLAGPSGRRVVSAADFGTDFFTTVLAPDEILTEIRLPRTDGWGARYEKFHRMAQSWATVGVAVAVRVEDRTIAEARVALANMGPVPVRAHAVEQALTGAPVTAEAVTAAADLAAEGTSPPTDLNGSAEYRRHLAKVLTGRAVLAACGER